MLQICLVRNLTQYDISTPMLLQRWNKSIESINMGWSSIGSLWLIPTSICLLQNGWVFMWLKMLLLLARYGRWWTCTKSAFATSIAQSKRNNRDVAEIKQLSQQVLTYFSITSWRRKFQNGFQTVWELETRNGVGIVLAFLFCACISVQKSTLNHRLLLEWDKRKPGTLTLTTQQRGSLT